MKLEIRRKLVAVITVVVLVALAGIVGYRLFLQPPAFVGDDTLMDFLPPAADIAVLHRGVEADWKTIRHSNWFRKLMARPDMKRFAHKNHLHRPELSDAEKWILDIVGDRVLAAAVPGSKLPGGYNIFAFAPIGARAKRLELMADLVQHGQKVGFKMTSSDHNGHEVVRVQVEDWPEGLVVKYTKLRGVAVVSFSDAEDTLERYLDGQITAPGLVSLVDHLHAELGRVNVMEIGAYRGRAGGAMRWVLESTGVGQLRLTTLAPLAGPPPAGVEGGMPSATLAARLSDDALLRVRGRLSEWTTMAAAYGSFFMPERKGAGQGALARLKENAPWIQDTFAVAMLPGQAMSSKLPLPVPQLALVLDCSDRRQAQTGIERAVMDLNSQTKMDLALQATTVAKSPAQRVISQSPELARHIKRWPVFAFAGNVLLAGSGDDILGAMLTRSDSRKSQSEENNLSWEVEPTVRMARGAMAAYALAQMFTGQQTPPDVALGLARLDFALDVLAGVRRLTMTGQVGGEAARLVVDMSCEDVLPGGSGSK